MGGRDKDISPKKTYSDQEAHEKITNYQRNVKNGGDTCIPMAYSC